jgi:protein-S-isoprenylcysteine O-methyltransferase Ste14
MESELKVALQLVWLVFMVYWLWSARKLKRSVQTEHPMKRFFAYWLPLFMAFVLGPGDWFGPGWLSGRFVPHSAIFEPIGLFLCVAGLVLACWARHTIGENWSAVVQLKENHQLITRGPYNSIRHPIYSGMLLLFLGTAIFMGHWRSLLAVAIVFASCWRKLRVEERWLSQLFGEVYLKYMARTRALIPGVL